jgi:gliding motility-associated-like protein
MVSSNATSFGGSDGKAKVTATGGTAPYTYLWSDGSTKDSIVNKPKGTYYVTVCDANLCCKSDSVIISDPPPIILTFTHTNNLCFGDSNAIATVSAVGGILPYTFTWNNGVVNDTITGLKAGTYTVTVADSAGITVSGNVTITQPTAINIIIDSVSILCHGGSNGSLQAVVSGGIPGYTYTWTGGTTANPKTGLTSGTYSVTVKDANNCTASVSAYLSQPDSLIATITSTVPTSCFGSSDGQATVQATGGTPNYSYAWSTGTSTSASATDLPVGNWSVTVTDANTCTATTTLVITQPAQIQLTITPISASCQTSNDGQAQANIVGGTPSYTYEWDGTAGANPTTGLVAGNHSVTVTDANGCSVSTNYNIDTLYVLHASATPTNASCATSNDGSAQVTVNGTPNYTYTWDGTTGPNPQTGLSTGSHTVSVADSKGCVTTTTFVIDTNYVLHTMVTPVNASCATSNDGSASVVTNGTPGYTYVWDGNAGNNPTTNLSTGTHSVVVTDSKNCVANASFVIDTNYVLHATLAESDATCFGAADGLVTATPLNGTASYNYDWSTALGNLNTTTAVAGLVTVTVTDAKNCVTTASIQVNEPTPVVVSTGAVDPNCPGKSDGYAWAAASGGTGAFTYLWSTSATKDSVFFIPAGTYTVTATDANTCSGTGTVTLVNPISVAVSVTQVDITCANADDGKATVLATGGSQPYSYVWSDNFIGDTRNNIASGTYQITVADAKGCDTILNLLYANPTPIEILLAKTDSISCPQYKDGKIYIEAQGGTPGTTQAYTYSIDGTTFQNNSIFENLANGTYTVYIKDANGCTKDTTLVVEAPQELVFLLEPMDSIGLGKSVTISPIISNYPSGQINGYSWSPSDGLSCNDCANPVASPYFETQYTLTIYYWANCVSKGTVTVKVGEEPDFYIPNAFSPNGDGKNDLLEVYGSGLKTVGLTIFNRWGEKVFDSNNQWLAWDGTYKGVLVNPGLYTYNAELEYLNGRKKHKFGSITLIR